MKRRYQRRNAAASLRVAIDDILSLVTPTKGPLMKITEAIKSGPSRSLKLTFLVTQKLKTSIWEFIRQMVESV